MNDYKGKKIMVVCGGFSSEREISLRSGKAVFDALQKKGYVNAFLFDLTRENAGKIIEIRPDIVFVTLHGKGGEDGCIQGLLELAGIPYTGSGVGASAVCMNKIFTKQVLNDTGLPTAKFSVLRKDDCKDLAKQSQILIEKIGLPMVLKSPCQGSSIGVVIVKEASEMIPAMQEVFKYGEHLLAEQFVDGTEITLPIMGNEELTVLPVIEITSEREFYDYTSKYTPGLCHHIIPACIDTVTEKKVIEIGRKAYHILNCCGLARIDFIIDKIHGPMIIEVNTSPGMTDMSLFPDAARYVGISYEELVERILLYGFATHRDLLD